MIYKFRIKPELMWWRSGKDYATDNPRDLWEVTNYLIERSLKEFFEYKSMTLTAKYEMERTIEVAIEKCIRGYTGKCSIEPDWFVHLVGSWYPEALSNYGGSMDLVIYKPEELKVIVNSLMVAKYMQKLL